MKKILAFVLVMVMVMALAACSVNVNTDQPLPGVNLGGGVAATNAATAAQTEAGTTEAAPTEDTQAAAPVETVPVETAPAATEAAPVEGGYIVLEGTPTLGSYDGSKYVNESIGLVMDMPEGVTVTSDADMLASFGLSAGATEAEILAAVSKTEGFTVITAEDASDDSSLIVQAVMKNTGDIDYATTAEAAQTYMTNNMMASFKQAGATNVTCVNAVAELTAGNSVYSLITCKDGTLDLGCVILSYEVGDYIVFLALVSYDFNMLDAMAYGIDIA